VSQTRWKRRNGAFPPPEPQGALSLSLSTASSLLIADALHFKETDRTFLPRRLTMDGIWPSVQKRVAHGQLPVDLRLSLFFRLRRQQRRSERPERIRYLYRYFF
ncbi:UNVERIFIED_CONTAM: hypothetical protein K2H54_035105, partial [Gekko kuhli]